MFNRCVNQLRAGLNSCETFKMNAWFSRSANALQLLPRAGVDLRACAPLHFSGADFNPTVEDALKKWCKVFSDEQVSEPLESIANILASTLNTNKIADVYKQRSHVLSDAQMEKVAEMCEKRLESMPVQYIIGEWDFREITLKIRPPVFIPRPETEILVELVLNDIKSRGVCNILELCCGGGAVSLALLNLIPELKSLAIDKSEAACKLAKENADNLGLSERLQVHHAEVLKCATVITNKYDLIVSNPPYILSGDMMGLQPEILLYEDLAALDGGLDGLDIIKQIFEVSSRLLNKEGKLFLEVDPSHPRLIRTWLARSEALGLQLHATHKDLTEETRFVEIIKR